MMQNQKAARLRRLTIWFSINLIIFILCYLNYRLQLKHRYLYKILNIGLCLSRAAAMVINFNLLLVWLPMCKYTITALACFVARLSASQREKLNKLEWLMKTDEENQRCFVLSTSTGELVTTTNTMMMNNQQMEEKWPKALQRGARRALQRFKLSIIIIKIKSINSFQVAVDHCTTLHTICATTITLASVVHTVAHLINVINFSKSFDPFLGTLNMAEYRGQNPLQLLVSVPGITGCFMMMILLLMSLSSIHMIRNSSFDLFQIFHRLSIIFVLLLILHPSSHVLKEQSNVSSFHPDLCPIINSTSNNHRRSNNTISLPKMTNGHRLIELEFDLFVDKNTEQQKTTTSGQQSLASVNCSDEGPKFVAQSSICWYVLLIGLSCYLLDLTLRRLRRSRGTIDLIEAKVNGENNLIELVMSNNHRRFNNWLPGQFVYLNCPQIAAYEWHPFTISSMDQTRGRFTLHIKTGGDWTRQLRDELEIRSLGGGGGGLGAKTNNLHLNTTSWLLSNQIYTQQQATTSGKLKSNYFFHHNNHHHHQKFAILSNNKNGNLFVVNDNKFSSQIFRLGPKLENGQQQVVATSDCIDQKTGQPKAVCKSLIQVHTDFSSSSHCLLQQQHYHETNLPLKTNNSPGHCCCCCPAAATTTTCLDNSCRKQTNDVSKSTSGEEKMLKLYVDGPFHSPFERLLEQQVSVCISNGVGWTAFSSVFQRIQSRNMATCLIDQDIWWSKWVRFATGTSKVEQQQQQQQQQQQPVLNNNKQTNVSLPSQIVCSSEETTSNVLHLVAIVTTMEQLKPFYRIASCYFNSLNSKQEDKCKREGGKNLVKEVTVFVTRSQLNDKSVSSFCQEFNLDMTKTKSDPTRLIINNKFSVAFGRPNLDDYLEKFSQIYYNRRKISVYCCGSYQVKQQVKSLCKDLNGRPKQVLLNGVEQQLEKVEMSLKRRPIYCYHEENF